MTTNQIATKVLNLAIENQGHRLQQRWIVTYLKITAEQLGAALAFLGNKIIRVRGTGASIMAA